MRQRFGIIESMLRGNRALVLAVAVYIASAGALALQQRGLQYDEALMVLGTVQMRNSPEILPLPQDADTWQCLRGRCFPLMTMSYVGAFKEYLTLPPMMLFGSTPAVVRLTSILWASLAVWGVGRFAGRWAALLLAISPSFADQTAFDNGAVVGTMGALGLMGTAAARYLKRPTGMCAFAIGAAAGLGFWCRANFLWILIGMLVGWAPEIYRWTRRQPWHGAALIAGAGVGSLPFWIYQFLSHWGTLAAAGMFRAEGTWAHLLAARASMFGRVLLSDSEHRAIWNGPVVPEWQILLLGAALVLALVACFAGEPRARGCGVALVVSCAFLFTSKLPVGEHHFIGTLPLVAAVCAFGGFEISRRLPAGRYAVFATGAVYAGLAVYWQGSAIAGIRATGGVGQWSDAIVDVRDYLQAKQSGKPVTILDWGLQNNLFVLADTRLKTREELENPDLSQGRLFLMNGPENTHYKQPREKFLAAVKASGVHIIPRVFRERGGQVFAELWDLNSKNSGAQFNATDPLPGGSSGFHEVEDGGWRWTKGIFTITLVRPDFEAEGVLELNIAEASIARLGPLTLSVVVDGKIVGKQQYSEAGRQRLVWRMEPIAGGAGERPVTMRFELDRYFKPGEVDQRELGVIVKSMAVYPASARLTL